MSLLTAKNVCLGYDRTVVAQGLSFTVNRGDYLCVVGENGSGKTTLMKTILRLHKPLSGEISVGEGLEFNEIGYLPQQTVIQKDFPASVKEIVLSGCLGHMGYRPFYGRKEKVRAAKSMEMLGISDIGNRCYRELSGGQQQRVLLARAFCAADKLLLLDEPVSGLDPNATNELYKVISDLNKNGMAIIMISHDIGTSLKYATHILHMGRDVFFGTRDEYRQSDEKEVFESLKEGDLK